MNLALEAAEKLERYALGAQQSARAGNGPTLNNPDWFNGLDETLRASALLLRQMSERLLMADAFAISEHVRVEMRSACKWAVVDDGRVLNDSGQWEHEPLASSRSDAFLLRTRWPLDEAIERARTALKGTP